MNTDFKTRIKALLDRAISELETTGDFSSQHAIKNLEVLSKIVVTTENWGSGGGVENMSDDELMKALSGEE